MDKSQMKTEALSRMRTLQEKFDLNPNLIRYLEDGKLYYSYRIAGWSAGCIDTIDWDERYATAVKDFEAKTGNYVYHVIETIMSMGQIHTVDMGNMDFSYLKKADKEPVTLLTLLYVSPNEEDWIAERLVDDYLLTYVMNLSEQNKNFYGGYFGEYGGVCLTSDGGALLCRG